MPTTRRKLGILGEGAGGVAASRSFAPQSTAGRDACRHADRSTADVKACPPRSARIGGFTLAEVLIAMSISTFVMIAVLSSFLMMTRSGVNAFNYVGMEEEARKGLERFGEDVRMAGGVTWTDNTRVTLSVKHASDNNSDTVIYYWDNTSTSSTYQCLLRNGPDPLALPYTGTAVTTTLIHDVKSFEFDRWMIGTSGSATNDTGTKQLQIRLTLRKQKVTTVAASNLVVSARFVLRNKT
jgi:type II secretory pathway pseudopilin PulG